MAHLAWVTNWSSPYLPVTGYLRLLVGGDTPCTHSKVGKSTAMVHKASIVTDHISFASKIEHFMSRTYSALVSTISLSFITGQQPRAVGGWVGHVCTHSRVAGYCASQTNLGALKMVFCQAGAIL